MKRLLFIGLFVSCTIYNVYAQGCYKDTRAEGIRLFSQKNFKRAKNVFIAAKGCPDKAPQNDLDYWIKKCNLANSPNTRKAEMNFAQKMALYESESDWSEGLMAVTRKIDWEKFYKLEKSGETDLYKDWPKVGFVNERGDLVIPCQYMQSGIVPIEFFAQVNWFSEGLACVAKYFEKEGYWAVGYINKQGKTIIPFWYAHGGHFSEGLTIVAYGPDVDDWYNNKIPPFFFIDKNGQQLSEEKYYNACFFSEGLCAVEKDSISGWGFIDKQGKIVIPCQYSYVTSFKDGIAAVRKSNSDYNTALINRKGEIIGDFRFRPEFMTNIDLYNTLGKEGYNITKHFEMCKECEKSLKDDYVLSYVYYRLGEHYYDGKAVAKDYEIAMKYFKQALKAYDNNKGSIHGQINKMAYNYMGLICSKQDNYSLSIEYYNNSLSCDKNYWPAMYNLGMLYYRGLQDYSKAMYWFSECANIADDKWKANANRMIEECKKKIGNYNEP